MSENESLVAQLEPRNVWANFAQLSQLPRPSKHEHRVVAWLKALAAEHDLPFEQDDVGNVLIRKEGTVGYKHAPVIVLQAHLDMVCQKYPDVAHDFFTDPITLVSEGEWLRANGTTLGADNGIGVAAMVAVLTSSDIAHGPLECLFTIDEEAGLNGAAGLRAGWLTGEILLNLDSEDEGELYVGCAGGQDINAQLSLTFEDVVQQDVAALRVSLGGLRGGHSGVDIHRDRGNAILLMAKVLNRLRNQFNLDIADFSGGSVRNAIPRDARATIIVAKQQLKEVTEYVSFVDSALKQRWMSLEPTMNLSAETVAVPAQKIAGTQINALLREIADMPNGVLGMLDDMPSVVETSCNVGAVSISEGKLRIQALARSSFEHKKNEVAKKIKQYFEATGADVEINEGYPGWAPDLQSPLLKTLSAVYEKNFGHVPEVKVIHAGLECGLLGAKYPNWQMISFGPTIRYPHSPEEKVHIESVEKFWRFLKASLHELAS